MFNKLTILSLVLLVTLCLCQVDNQDYIDYVFEVSEFLRTEKSSISQTNHTDILDFTKGFLEGVGSASAFDEIKACIADSEDIYNDVDNGIIDIKTKDSAKVKQGVALLGQAAQLVPNAVQECKAADLNLQNLIKMIETFKTPSSFFYFLGKSLLINHVEVIKEVEEAVAAYDAQNCTGLGYWLGKAMDTVFLGEDQKLSQSFVDHLNEVSGWEAAIPDNFEGMTIRDIRNKYLGAILTDHMNFEEMSIFSYHQTPIRDIPANFNASEQWPDCIGGIRDQGHCAGSWSFAAAETLSDRFCIASNGSVKVNLSPQYLLSCNNILNRGCVYGTASYSWKFLTSDGIVSEECLPYASYNGTDPVKCREVTKCADGSVLKKYYVQANSIVQASNTSLIQANILQYGPIEATMNVYQDFMYYKSGIYKHTSGDVLEALSVRLLGWGNDNGTDYWIGANSWGPTWGEDGYFKIKFGECDIDYDAVAGQPDLTRVDQSEISFW